jgi:hypothetical protein
VSYPHPYTKRLGATTAGAASAVTTLATCPAGKVWIATDVTFWAAGVGDSLQLTSSGGVPILFAHIANVLDSVHWTGRAVVVAGQALQYYALGSNIRIAVTGYELEA